MANTFNDIFSELGVERPNIDNPAYYIRRMAKAANERMRQLEKKGTNSPAYKEVQAALDMIGGKPTAEGKFRFSETGKFSGTKAEQRSQLKALEKYMSETTSSVRGFKKFQTQVYNTANKKYHLKERGIGKEEYFEMWDRIDDISKDRMFYADVYIELVEEAKAKGDKRSIKDIIDLIESSESKKEAMEKIGITERDYQRLS